MSGTPEGGQKAKLRNLEKNPNFYSEMGRLGGQKKVPKGFSFDRRTWLEKLLRKPKLASRAGAIGGRISKRKKVT